MTDIANDKLNECVQRFVDLANTMQREKIPQGAISTALMAASGIYATFVAAGNEESDLSAILRDFTTKLAKEFKSRQF